MAASFSVDSHIVSHAVTMAIHSFIPSVAEWLGVSTWCLWSRVRCPLTGKGPMPSHLTGRLLSHWCEFVACHTRVDEIVEKRGGFGPLDLHSLFAWCNPVSSRYFPPQNLLNAGVRTERASRARDPWQRRLRLPPKGGCNIVSA